MIKTTIDSLGRGALVRPQRIAAGRSHPAHTHFWERAVSRRTFIQGTSAAAAGMLILGSGNWMPASAAVPGNTPTPIPGGFMASDVGCTSSSTEIFHNFAPHVFDPPDTDRSGIFNFKGDVGYTIIDGTGTGRNSKTGGETPLSFEVDLRFMQGEYFGVDGKRRRATFYSYDSTSLRDQLVPIRSTISTPVLLPIVFSGSFRFPMIG